MKITDKWKFYNVKNNKTKFMKIITEVEYGLIIEYYFDTMKKKIIINTMLK